MSEALKVLIVDDSITYRSILSSVLGMLPEVTIVGTTSNGKSALVKLSQIAVDMLLLDIEMPEMNGLETLQVVSRLYPHIGVVMVSGMNRHSADVTIKALEAGALDFIPKPDGDNVDANMETLRQKLLPIFKLFAAKRHLKEASVSVPKPVIPTMPVSHTDDRFKQIDIIAIGVSTGGPNALNEVIPKLPGDLGVPVLLVQHMPPMFTASLANSLDKKSVLHVKEAEFGEAVLPNTVYIAPGGQHMTVASGRIVLNDDPPENSCRPSVDVLFRSVARAYGKNILAVVMTGMGSDGVLGVKALKEKGECYCITQSAESSVVYGMPKAVDQQGLSDEKVALAVLAKRMTSLVKRTVLS